MSGPKVAVSAKMNRHGCGVLSASTSMSTGRLPSIEGMIVRPSPPPVIARIRDWSSRIWSTLTPCTPLAPMANPGTAVPPTTLVQAATK